MSVGLEVLLLFSNNAMMSEKSVAVNGISSHKSAKKGMIIAFCISGRVFDFVAIMI